MISASLEGRLPYMTYPEPWRGPPKQPPEFLRPAPKPVPPTSRYNGVNTSPNGTRLVPSQRTISKYPHSPTSLTSAVNLTQHKDEIVEELPYYRIYPPNPHFPPFPSFSNMYQPYSHIMRSTFPTTPLPPMEPYSPTTPTSIPSTFLPPPSNYSPPSALKSPQGYPRDKRITLNLTSQPPQSAQIPPQQVAFKVPSGKEGSLKHRILTRPEDAAGAVGGRNVPLDLQKSPLPESPVRKTINARLSPPRSPKMTVKTFNNNNSVPGNFTKGSLIQLTTGELKRIEDMRTEDFVSSAENSLELRLADSTVVKIDKNHATGMANIVLSYNQRRAEVEVETTLEHPFFVFGQGWASCSPDRTQNLYHLKVHRLYVGDVLVSLTPREQQQQQQQQAPGPRTSTIMTTATSTAMTVRPISSCPKPQAPQTQPMDLHSAPLSPDSAARKRRWSAPDQICDEEEQMMAQRKLRVD